MNNLFLRTSVPKLKDEVIDLLNKDNSLYRVLIYLKEGKKGNV
jgi:hypothetical protein